MKIRVFDSEGVGLGHNATELHNMCYTEDGEVFHFTTDKGQMKEWLLEDDVLWVCHNAHGHDLPAFKAVLGVDLEYSQAVCTMAVSWFLYPQRSRHGLESWGLDLGFEKVKVEEHQWAEGDEKLMKERVERDVLINWLLWQKQLKKLEEIYGTCEEMNPDILRFLRYLSFKMDCLREQNENPLLIDLKKAQEHHDTLLKEVEAKKAELAEAMPRTVVTHERPKRYKRKDGELTKWGIDWDKKCEDFGQTKGTLKFREYLKGNPNSDPQLKEWLFSLGWEPCTYKFVRDKSTGDEKQIPQVRYFSQNDPRKGELTESIKALLEEEPALQALDGLTMAKHRLSIFVNFLKLSNEDGCCSASAGGFTNTLRLQHRNPFVNLPKADGEVPWGEEIRGCIVAPNGYEMCGSDVVSLEATTKRHYMYPHDPEYADAMGSEGFDEHLDLSVHAGALTQKEIEEKGKQHPEIKSVRKQYKATNYSAIYGVGPPKLARELFITKAKSTLLLSAYWDRNWSIKKVAEEQYVKTLKDGSMWLKNPVSGFYYSLRYLKDVFSTLNQGTGVYIFDSWLMRVRKKGVVVPFQYHDELMTLRKLDGESRESLEAKLHESMEGVNESLSLNVSVSVDVQFGDNYKEVH